MEMRFWLYAIAALLGLAATPGRAKAPGLVSLADAFPRFYDATATLPEKERVARFRKEFGALLPGFYAPRNRTDAAYDTVIAKSLHDFPDIRAKYEQVERDFPKAFAQGQKSFRKAFADYRLTVPVYLLHSLGEMDGGTRQLDGKTVGVFGADVIAKIHTPATTKPFLDHELFHLYHAQFFPDCDPLWCSVWEEGLAVYVASRLNPGATDEQLLLTQPRPIRPEVEPRLKDAMCSLSAKLESTKQEDYAPFFFAKKNDGPFPPRYGYLLGYMLVSKIGADKSLEQLAKLPPDKVKAALVAAIASYGACA
jgi:hypothetical protein